MYIYKITNIITNQSYVGQTIDYKKRWNNHKDLYKFPHIKGGSRPLYKAMRSYGIENFSFSVLEECEDVLANEREEYYIVLYNTIKKGYNHESSTKHKYLSETTKKKIAEAQIGEKIICSAKKSELCKNSKKCIDLTTGKIYNSMRECALDEFGDIKYVKYISRICQPHTKRFGYKGHTYRLIDDEGNIIPKDADGENLNEFNSHGDTVPSSLKNEKV